MVTAYDYPGAVQADLAEIDIILVGDSVGMVELGHETTQVSDHIARGEKWAALCGTF
jgi:ketopantoate hydroxymethyltransferase